MEGNFSSGISHLDSLLEKHKQLQERSVFKSYYESRAVHNNTNISHMGDYYAMSFTPQAKLPVSTSKVYVNPNFTRSKPVIHINPHVQIKPSVYVNPKLIQNIVNTPNQDQLSRNIVENTEPTNFANSQNKCSVHVNPRLMNKLISKAPKETQIIQQNCNIASTSNNINCKISKAPLTQSKPESSHLSDTDSSNVSSRNNSTRSTTPNIKKKSIAFSTPVSQKKSSTNYIIQSKTKIIKSTSTLKKSPNNSFIALSRRKLIRVKRGTKAVGSCPSTSKQIIPLQRRLSNSGLKKIKISPKSVLTSSNQLSRVNNLKSAKSINVYKLNCYNKIDKTIVKSSSKKSELPTRKVLNNTGLVSIGGIMYKKSRNQLIRSSPGALSSKRKRSLTSNKSNEYYITKNGKKLLKLDSTIKKINISIKRNTLITPTKCYKTNISNKVKQRSLQILRNKMRKNNQPCLLFQRLGYCSKQIAGTCPKVHNKNQVALCRNFLQGKCLLDDCPLSHNVGPEKMPTCKYFLEGCCTHDGCPYLHVKVSSKNPICVEFLRGYCPQGNECQNRHIYACPEFDKSSKCSKGKSCPYPHKSKLTETKRTKGGVRRKDTALSAKQSEKVVKSPTKCRPDECRKRYYEDMNGNDNGDNSEQQDLNKKREKLDRYIKIMKNVHAAESISSKVSSEEKQQSLEHNNDINVESINDSEEKLEIDCNRPRRPPIGPLPAYIPIDL